MLSRSAEGLYWMGRHLERTEHLARLLQLQVEALVDRPVREIHCGWRRLYGCLGRKPTLGDLHDFDSDDLTLADSFTLADDLTFEPANPVSMRSCFASARENARQMRHCISGEMWSSLNLSWLGMRDLRIQDIWRDLPEGFYAAAVRDVGAFWGVADRTMYRDAGWNFMQLGRSVERAQLATALLLAQRALARDGDAGDPEWIGLLRACQAFDAYTRLHGFEIRPGDALDLVVGSSLLPCSLRRSLDRCSEILDVIAPGPDAAADAAARRLTGRLVTLVRHAWPDRGDKDAVLGEALRGCRELHDRIMLAFVSYPLENG